MNRLAKEQSPYLLQHKDNPVDWYPWGEEAFEKARAENKPVFLSIGYATCHWCHVMAHESFEDEDIAGLLNESYIAVKVDREERPDIDSTYMTVCQMLNGHGGWPLTIVMTPDKEPFFAGTYIPKEARFQRIGLRQLLPGIKGMWDHEPAKVRKAVESIKDGYSRSLDFEKGPFPGTESIDFAAEQLMQRYDKEMGGYGSSPKFPTPHNLMFLLREWDFKKEDRFRDSVVHTLKAMRKGGIWDHIGYGFHRYSTDREWLLPHFEKMLYDQALLMMAYTEGWQVSEEPLFKQTVDEIAAYVFRDLTHPEGAFYSAEDADSEGEEGLFYLWETEEIDAALSVKEADWFKERFQFFEEGNFEDEATKERTGKNIPHLKTFLHEDEGFRFDEIREKLFSLRTQRIRPELDDKILTDWNALMIAALAKAGSVFNTEEYIRSAEQAYQFITGKLVQNGELYHRYKEGEAAIHAFADDYAFLIWAAIELYQATAESRYLQDALKWNEKFTNELWDPKDGAFYLSGYEDDQPLGRPKQIYDGAIPSSNSAALLNLIRLSRLTGQTGLEDQAQMIGTYFSSDMIRSGSSVTLGMQAIQFLNYDPREIVVASPEKSGDQLMQDLRERFLPQAVLLHHSPEDELLKTLAPFLKNQLPVDGKPTVFICRNYACEQPVIEPDSLDNLLTK